MDVTDWLKTHGLDRYAAAFAANNVDAEVLPTLTDADLKVLGVASLGHRKKLLLAISALAGPPGSAAGELPVPPVAPRPPRHLAERILAARETLLGERKEVTVLFADVQGSLGLIEGLDAEQSAARLLPAIETMAAAVHRFEGTVAKVQGDGIMALFGAPVAHEDHALRAGYAALAMRDSLAELSERTRREEGYEMRARVGLHSGEVVVRGIGTDFSVDYDAIGPTVHLANRLEQLALPGTIRLSAATRRLAEGYLAVESLGLVPVKGSSEPIEVYDLRGATGARNRLQALGERGLSPFVGRSAELAVLEDALARAKAGEGRVVGLVGEAGVGKSRLGFELSRSAAARGCLVLSGASVSYGRATPWVPILDLLRAYFRIDSADDERAVREKVTGKALALDASLARTARILLTLFAITADFPEWSNLEPPQRRRLTLDAIRTLLLAEAAIQPLLLIVEDLHWADGETLALLDGLIGGIVAHRVMVLATYRPEFVHPWGGRSAFLQVRLDSLLPVGLADLLASLVGNDPIVAPLKARLAAQAGGNPLYVEEGVRALAELGLLVGLPGSYRFAGDPADLPIPDGVRAIIAARIDRLPPEQKQLLQAASVVGSEVPFDRLAGIADLDPEALEVGLSALQAGEFLYETRLFPDRHFAFKHAFTHEVAYGGLLRSRRRDLHGRLGAAIEAGFGPSVDVEALAGHFERGEIWEKAARYWLAAAERAKGRFAYRRGIDVAERALACAEHLEVSSDLPPTILALLGDLSGLLGSFEDANAWYGRALKLPLAPETRHSIANRVHRRAYAGPEGSRVAYHVHGSGDECIVMVSPEAYEVQISQPLLERICQGFTVVTVHPRGDGPSDPAPRPYTIGDQVLDYRRVFESLGPGRRTAIGYSRGGTIAMRLAHDCPDLIDRLVLVDAPADEMGPTSRFARPDGLSERILGALDSGDIRGAAAIASHSVFSEEGYFDYAEASIADWFVQGEDVAAEWLRTMHSANPELDVGPILPSIRVPTLVTHGTEDRRIPVAAAHYLASRIPGAALYLFRGRGHIPFHTAPAEAVGVLEHFIRTGTARVP
jgi:class 3 adenylate cyclase/pimeloyl-ACP methyl ester carboxylesterase